MTATDGEMTAFFAQFSSGSARLDPELLGARFAEVFLVGDASGAKPVSREAFLRMLPQRAETFTRAGIGTPVLDQLTFDNLDDHYTLARTEWTAPRDGGDTVRLVSSYLLHRQDGALRVVAYLNHRGPNTPVTTP